MPLSSPSANPMRGQAALICIKRRSPVQKEASLKHVVISIAFAGRETGISGDCRMKPVFETYMRGEIGANVVVNSLINVLIIWFTKKDSRILYTEGEEGYGIDIIVTCFLLFFLMSLVVLAIQRSRVKSGKAPDFNWEKSLRLHRILARFPRSVWLSALLFGVLALFIYAPVTLVALGAVGVTEFTPLNYTIFKGIWVAVMVWIAIPSILRVGLAR